ncbi:MAG: hypothetical protein WDW38_003124 [Sanguina aurantia]
MPPPKAVDLAADAAAMEGWPQPQGVTPTRGSASSGGDTRRLNSQAAATAAMSSVVGQKEGELHQPPAAAKPPVASRRHVARTGTADTGVEKVTIRHEEGGGPEDRMAWGAGGGGKDLSAGRFDEGDSHHSFLEALNAWRQGTKPPEAGQGSAAAATTGSDARNSTTNSSSSSNTTGSSSSSNTNTSGSSSWDTSTRPQQQASTETQVQTEVRLRGASLAPSPPATSYFNRLASSSASRQAGSDASSHSSSRPHTSSQVPESCSQPAPEPIESSSAAPSPQEPQPENAVLSRLSILDKLESLEMDRAKLEAEEDRILGLQEAQESVEIEFTTVVGLGITRAMRLPDSIMLPSY